MLRQRKNLLNFKENYIIIIKLSRIFLKTFGDRQIYMLECKHIKKSFKTCININILECKFFQSKICCYPPQVLI